MKLKHDTPTNTHTHTSVKHSIKFKDGVMHTSSTSSISPHGYWNNSNIYYTATNPSYLHRLYLIFNKTFLKYVACNLH